MAGEKAIFIANIARKPRVHFASGSLIYDFEEDGQYSLRKTALKYIMKGLKAQERSLLKFNQSICLLFQFSNQLSLSSYHCPILLLEVCHAGP